MENKFDLDYLKSLYESLDVSDGAKNRFFETFLKEAQAEANPNAKKAGLIHKFLAWLNKGTPTVESSAQAILEALTGIERIIQTSPLLVNDKLRGERDLKYLEKYKTQIERATQDIIDAQAKNKEAQDRFFQSNPQVQNAQAQLDQAAEEETKELEIFQQRIEDAKDKPEELQSLRTEAEKIQDEKVKAENDPEAGDAYEELIEKIDELNPEDTSNLEENPEAQPKAEEASTVEAENTGETVESNVEEQGVSTETQPETEEASTESGEVSTGDTPNPEENPGNLPKDEEAPTVEDGKTGKTGETVEANVDEQGVSTENPSETKEASTESGETVKDKVDDKNIGYYGTGKSRGSVFDLNDEEEQLHQFNDSTTPINTDKKLAE